MSAVLGMGFLLATGVGCDEKKADWVAQKQKEADAVKAAKKSAQDAEERAQKEGPQEKADPVFDAPGVIQVRNGGSCPAGMWALFSDDIPGTGPEKAQNKAKRPELEKQLREATFATRLRSPDGVLLREFDTGKGQFPVEVLGLVDCQDSVGHLAIAWGEAKAVTPPHSAAQQDAPIAENIWQATPLSFFIVKTLAESRDFAAKHKFDFDARLLFKLGKAEVNKKMWKPGAKRPAEDWGAGRMVHAVLQTTRVTTDHGQSALTEASH